MVDQIIIQPPNPAWAQLFEAEKGNLLSSHEAQLIAIEHVGSTAVPGLHAKPIIDMLGGVLSMAQADALLEPLCQLGWDTSAPFNATLTDRRFLLRWPQGVRTHHLHLVVHASETWHRTLQFRDALRTDTSLAQAYQKLKYELAEKYRTDREAYTDAKTDFITRALSETRRRSLD